MFIYRFVQLRRVYFIVSAVVIGIGLLSMGYSLVTRGSVFPLGIDFVGGTIFEIRFESDGMTESGLRDVFAAEGITSLSIQRIGPPEEYRWSVRSGFQSVQTIESILDDLDAIVPIDRERSRTETISASVGAEASRAAVIAVFVATLVVTGFIVVAFRSVPNAVRYGVCAILAMFHDVLIVCGFASVFGLLLGWEVDALFLTAVLTVVGFSVQDTIVMFDRIRENIPKFLGEPYDAIVNRSVLETMHRSLATQLNAFFIMIAILLFGGESIKQFIAILFIGLLTGTYSSLFIAVPLLASWEKGELPLISRKRPAVPVVQPSET
ncbi:MAG: protein translocase subunit SecF [Pleurocapsa minor GSE-CHR-MK-17-07R]|jgi:preprotein translocase SecF subunit|nr:protein translocase subunit SecF [Pleurocapsa minor GSE-CHR-MK 17-07R]